MIFCHDGVREAAVCRVKYLFKTKAKHRMRSIKYELNCVESWVCLIVKLKVYACLQFNPLLPGVH